MVNFKNFDLNLLRVLDALLRDRSTVKAGDRLGLSQPAVSAALGRLRHATGDELLVRQGRDMVPTKYAQGIAGPLREEMARLEEIFSIQAFDPKTSDATFRICGSDFFADMLMPPLLARMKEVAPNVTIQLVDLVPDGYIETLDRYGAEMALIPDGDFPEWLEKQHLFASPFVVIAAKGHPAVAEASFKSGDVFPLDLFCTLDHALFSPQGNIRSMGDDALDNIGRSRRVIVTLPAFSGVCRTVSESEVIALVPCQYAERFQENLGLDVFAPPMPLVVPNIALIWQRRLTDNPAQQWFRQQVLDLMQPLDAMAQHWLAKQ
jgi:DNA-binding transcriptional LysR family regulator